MVIPKGSSSIANANCRETIRFANLIDQQYHHHPHLSTSQHYLHQPHSQLTSSAQSSPSNYHPHHHFNTQQISKLNPPPSRQRSTIKSPSTVNTVTIMIDAAEDLLLSYGADQSAPSPPAPHPDHHSTTTSVQSALQPSAQGINLSVSSALSPTVNLNVTGSTGNLVTLGKRVNKRRSRVEAGTNGGETMGDTLLACLVCGKNFVSFGRLKSHEKTHSKSRPFKCIDCGKTFTVRYSLICHTRVHTRERPYGCAYCGSRFSQASSLKTHQIYKHTKDFPYMCKYCGRGFISPGQKHEHIQRAHLKSSSFSSTVSPSSLASSPSSSSSSSSSTSPHVDCHLSRLKSCRPLAPEPLPSIQPRPHGPKMATTSVQTDIRLPPDLIY